MSADAVRFAIAANPSPMTLDGTRTFVVGFDRPVVVDPGPVLPDHLDAILELLDGRTPVAIVVTHSHTDHAAMAPTLAERTGAPVWMGLPPRGPERLRRAVSRRAGDGDTIESDVGTLRILETPGHTPDHLVVLWEGRLAPRGCAAFVGDLLMGAGDTTLVSPPDGDLRDYLHSLERLSRRQAAVLFPGHGPPIEDPQGALERYRAHRLTRIEQVRTALLARPDDDPDALVDRVYGPELDPSLRKAAAGSITAVVRYLRNAP